MPKILSVPGHNDSSFDLPNIPVRRFNQQNTQPPTIRQSHYDSVVPIHEVQYNPEFSKSPLASVQIARKDQNRKVDFQPLEEPQESIVYRGQPNFNQYEDEKCEWKNILFWVFIILGCIGLAVGLYFLLDAVLGKKSLEKNQNSAFSVQTETKPTGGVSPIYVQPIPYDSYISSKVYSSKQTEVTTASTSNPSVGITYPSLTYPISSEKSKPNLTNTKNIPEQQKQISTVPTKSQSSEKQSPVSPSWNYDSLADNSIQPLNAYEAKNQ